MKSNSNLATKTPQMIKKGRADRCVENGHVFPLTVSLTGANNGLESAFELLVVSVIQRVQSLYKQ